MSSLNKVFLMGRLTRDPELRYVGSGTPVCEMGLAVNRSFTAADGNKREDACFIDITAWRKTAETTAQYLKKGSTIFVEGYLKMDAWESTGGQKRSKIRVVAQAVRFLDRVGRATDGGAPAPAPAPQPSTASARGPEPPEEAYKETERISPIEAGGPPEIREDEAPPPMEDLPF